jgi:hypothetical protein
MYRLSDTQKPEARLDYTQLHQAYSQSDSIGYKTRGPPCTLSTAHSALPTPLYLAFPYGVHISWGLVLYLYVLKHRQGNSSGHHSFSPMPIRWTPSLANKVPFQFLEKELQYNGVSHGVSHSILCRHKIEIAQ